MNAPESETHAPRWGVLGGTFDPPHRGHFELARSAADELELDRVLWVPSYRPPHKQDRALSSFVHRATMTELTARRDPRFDVSHIESTLPGDSFTVKTLAHLAKALPEMELFFIVGADVLPELRDWFKPERISRWATLACGVRPGYERPEKDDLPVDRVIYFASPAVDIASRVIRGRVRAGQALEGEVAPAVEQYIRDHRLYQ